MLQLQLKSLAEHKLPKKVIVFFKISCLCIIVHGIVLALFFTFSDIQQSLYINTLSADAPIVFVPFLKSAQQKTVTVAAPIPSVQHKKVVTPKRITKPKPIKPLPKKRIVRHKKPAPKKVVQKKVVKSPVIKKTEPVKIPEVKQEIPKESTVIAKAAEHTPKEDNAVIEASYEDRDILVISNHIKQDILKVWKRPATISTNVTCHMRVILSKEGERTVIIEKPSGALALDINARNFLLRYAFPDQLKGKELTIIF